MDKVLLNILIRCLLKVTCYVIWLIHLVAGFLVMITREKYLIRLVLFIVFILRLHKVSLK